MSRQVIDVLGYILNIPLVISITLSLAEYFVNQSPSAAAVTKWSYLQVLPRKVGSKEPKYAWPFTLVVRRSKQYMLFFGWELSEQNIYLLVIPIDEMFTDYSGSNNSIFFYKNSKSHMINLPPTLPVPHSLPFTSIHTILSSCIKHFCSDDFISHLIRNRPAGYTKYYRLFITQV